MNLPPLVHEYFLRTLHVTDADLRRRGHDALMAILESSSSSLRVDPTIDVDREVPAIRISCGDYQLSVLPSSRYEGMYMDSSGLSAGWCTEFNDLTLAVAHFRGYLAQLVDKTLKERE